MVPPEVTYIHVELPAHDALLAAGLPVESHLDTGDRSNLEKGRLGCMAVRGFLLGRAWSRLVRTSKPFADDRRGARSFEILSSGLSRSHAYDVVNRHAVAIVGIGDLLAFGSTTSGLWASEDGGESWSNVTHTLPLIYGVRFGCAES